MFTIASGRADVFKVMGDGVEIKMDELDLGSVQGQPEGYYGNPDWFITKK